MYLQDEKEIDEYVMKEHGLMGRGTYDDPEMVSWRFGQFDQNVIEASFVLLREVGKLAISSCNDPVLVSRTFTQAVSRKNDVIIITREQPSEMANFLFIWFSAFHSNIFF